MAWLAPVPLIKGLSPTTYASFVLQCEKYGTYIWPYGRHTGNVPGQVGVKDHVVNFCSRQPNFRRQVFLFLLFGAEFLVDVERIQLLLFRKKNHQESIITTTNLVLNPEQKCLQDEGNNYGHDNHGDDIKRHEKDPGPVASDCRVSLHDNEPIIDHSQLKQGHSCCRHVVEVIQPVISIGS